MIASMMDFVAFLKHFHNKLGVEPSLKGASIPDDLPSPLATLHRELGALVEIEPAHKNHWRSPFQTHDRLYPVHELELINGMYAFASQNQQNWTALCEAGHPDPPVFLGSDDAWFEPSLPPICDSLSHFLITLCLQEAVFGCRNVTRLHTTEVPREVLSTPLKPLWLNGYLVDGKPDHNFYTSPERDLLLMEWSGIWAGSPFRRITKPWWRVW